MKALLLVVGIALAAAPALAQQGTMGGGVPELKSLPQGSEVPQSGANGSTNANGERLICRRIEVTERRSAARRVCLTAREWRQHDSN